MDDTAGMGSAAWQRDRRTPQAVARNFEVIAEAVNPLHRHARDRCARIGACRRITGPRSAPHGDDAIDDRKVWLAVQEPLPVARAEIEQVLREGEENENP